MTEYLETTAIVSGWVHKRMNVDFRTHFKDAFKGIPSEKNFPIRRQANKVVRDMFANECGMQDFCVTSAVSKAFLTTVLRGTSI